MAKEKRSAADLDAELAALEAEIAALEGKKKAPPKPVPKRAEPTRAQEKTAPAPIPEKRSRFAMPKLGRKHEPTSHAAPVGAPLPPPTPAPAPGPAAPAPSAPRAESYDASVWRQDGDAWVRTVPETPVPVIRRVLDENGNVVREEPARASDVEDVTGVKAERGLGKLLRRR